MTAQRNPNRFAGLLDRRDPIASEPETDRTDMTDHSDGAASDPIAVATPPPIAAITAPPTAVPVSATPASRTGRGRAKKSPTPAKRGNPDYTPLTVYIKQTTRHSVGISLAHMHDAPELSELVDELLADWAKKRRPS